jgi:hypothetical protein
VQQKWFFFLNSQTYLWVICVYHFIVCSSTKNKTMLCTSLLLLVAAFAFEQAAAIGLTQRAYGGAKGCAAGTELDTPAAETIASYEMCSGCRKDLFEGEFIGCDGSDSMSLKNDCIPGDNSTEANNCMFEAQKYVSQNKCERTCNEDDLCGFFSWSQGHCNLHMVLTCFHTDAFGYDLFRTPVTRCQACEESHYQAEDNSAASCQKNPGCWTGSRFVDVACEKLKIRKKKTQIVVLFANKQLFFDWMVITTCEQL